MCGITGLYAFNELGRFNLINLAKATACLSKRGPDDQGMYLDHHVGLGHRRLSIIDLSDHAKQPMAEESGRYTLVFNGEIYNFQALRQQLQQAGFNFKSTSDTEVLLNMYIWKGSECLNLLNGFFSFAIYDRAEDSLFLARDRFGVKPLFYFLDEDKIIFASELKSIFAYGIPKELDHSSIFQYFQLNYIPAPFSILKNLKKLMPGTFLFVKDKQVKVKKYYQIPYSPLHLNPEGLNYEQQQKKFHDLLEQAVHDRLIADVPLGAFLSGGIDSSVIVALASQHTKGLNTFSIGYKDEPYFDETAYASLVAKHFDTSHTVFSLSNQDMYQHLFDILDYLDEPFADSSAIPTYVLSMHTRKTATVALSGDGADELLSGYQKHAAAFRAMEDNSYNKILKGLAPVWKMLPQSRNNFIFNKFRQLDRYASGLKLSSQERYWQWATFMNNADVVDLLSDSVLEGLDFDGVEKRQNRYTNHLTDHDFNNILLADMQLVLPNDMLVKVDLMSMANGLEVRSPFLDYRLVEFVFSLPVSSKINTTMRKRILQDTFREILPPQLYRRPKKGFEVPLLKWFRTDLKNLIFDDLLNDEFIQSQQIFNPGYIKSLQKRLFSVNPGDVHAQLWALVVFQWWWKKYFNG